MPWTKVLASESLAPGMRHVVEVSNQKILLLNHEGTLYALNNACPHLKLSMKKGKITEDGAIICPWHRSAFDLKTGNVKTWTPWPPVIGKAMGMVSSQKAISVFPIRDEEGSIWIDIA